VKARASYYVSPVALGDIDEIADQIHSKNPAAAQRFLDRVYDAFELLAVNPHAGHPRKDLTDLDVFFWPVLKRYAVIYRKADVVEIVHVRRWKQDLKSLLRDKGTVRR
jgi:plasmid stabilization system protein ParE